MIESNRPSKDNVLHMLRCCLAEFVAVFYFVYSGSLSTVYPPLAAPAHGLAIALMVAATGRVSGGHVNPAVTLGVAIAGGVPWLYLPFYWLAQLIGAMLASAAVLLSVSSNTVDGIHGGVPFPNEDLCTNIQAVLMEGILTFGLVFTVLSTAVDKKGHIVAPLVIGFAVFVGVCAGGSFSGGVMNPARAFGPAAVMAMNGRHWTTSAGPTYPFYLQHVYWVGPLIGAAIAGVIYKLVLASKEQRWLKIGNRVHSG